MSNANWPLTHTTMNIFIKSYVRNLILIISNHGIFGNTKSALPIPHQIFLPNVVHNFILYNFRSCRIGKTQNNSYPHNNQYSHLIFCPHLHSHHFEYAMLGATEGFLRTPQPIFASNLIHTNRFPSFPTMSYSATQTGQYRHHNQYSHRIFCP